MRPDISTDAARATFFERLQALLDELPGLFNDRIDLLSLELRSAGMSLAMMLLWMTAAAILGVTAWLGIWGAVGAALILYGWPWPAVVAGIVILNLLAAVIAVSRARALAPRLGLPLTRRHLRFGIEEDAISASDELVVAAHNAAPQGASAAGPTP
ncbi:MAG: phage holin family protein [Burkholderiales bacterium]